MKSQALQELTKKIFGDEETKHQFLKDPDSVVAQFNLTKQEKEAVLNTHAKLGMVTSDSLQLEAALDPTGVWHAPTP